MMNGDVNTEDTKAVCEVSEANLRIRMQKFINEHLRERALRIRTARRKAAGLDLVHISYEEDYENSLQDKDERGIGFA